MTKILHVPYSIFSLLICPPSVFDSKDFIKYPIRKFIFGYHQWLLGYRIYEPVNQWWSTFIIWIHVISILYSYSKQHIQYSNTCNLRCEKQTLWKLIDMRHHSPDQMVCRYKNTTEILGIRPNPLRRSKSRPWVISKIFRIWYSLLDPEVSAPGIHFNM